LIKKFGKIMKESVVSWLQNLIIVIFKNNITESNKITIVYFQYVQNCLIKNY